MNVKDLTITSIETITAFELNGGVYKFTLDELQNASIAQTQESQDITGKQGRKISSLKRNKAVTISGTNGLVSGGLLELQTSSEFENKSTPVAWTDYITVGDTTKTTYTAIGASGEQIRGLYVKNTDGTIGRELVQITSGTPATGEFIYNSSTNELTFASADSAGLLTSGTELVAFYERNITADVLVNHSDINVLKTKCCLYIDAYAEDKCANQYHVQFYIPKADFSGEFTFEMGDNQTVHNFEAEALAGGCTAGDAFWTFTVFGVNDGDKDLLEKITITTQPSDTTYSVGDSFDPTGMVVKATYEGKEDQVTLNPGSYTYTPNGALTAADKSITVSYTENGVTKTAACAITVS